KKIHSRMRSAVTSAGGRIDAVFYCPHRPEEGCRCRKPEPGLIMRAQQAFSLDLSTACLVGDSEKDMEAAWRAGCATTILVRTGNGRSTEKNLAVKRLFPDFVAEDLLEAVRWLLDRNEP
ncbi:D-glycero-alpha-D-manno-heptose-1,7-bisphosphate 7-phosphatase, partial [Thermodesulfobacteriota bacterium]